MLEATDHDDIPLLSIVVSNNMNKVWEAIGNKLKGLPEVSALVAGWSSDEDSDDIDVDDKADDLEYSNIDSSIEG